MCYMKTYRTVHIHMVAAKAAHPQRIAELKTSKNLAIILSTHLIFWTPYVTVIFYGLSSGREANAVVDACCLTLLGLNAVLTPAIFAAINKALKRAVINTVLCRSQASHAVLPSYDQPSSDESFVSAEQAANHVTFIGAGMRMSPRSLMISPSTATRGSMCPRTPSLRALHKTSSFGHQFDRAFVLKPYASTPPTISEDMQSRHWLTAGPSVPIVTQQQQTGTPLTVAVSTVG